MAEDSPSRVQSEAESTEQGHDDASEEDAAQKLRRGHPVSRPPSSHITRVDEESSASDSGSRSAASRLLRPGSRGISGSHTSSSVETVDRGVGPTPLPVPPSSTSSGSQGSQGSQGSGSASAAAAAASAASDHYPHVPNFLLPPFIDPRNGLLESAYGMGYPYPPPYPTYINQPLPLSSNTLEGRYHWPPPTFHQPLPPGLAPSPVHSDISMLSMRSPGLPGESVTQLASRIQWEQLQRAYYHSPGPGRRFSPASLGGLPLGPGSLPAELAHALGHRGGTASGYVSGSDAGRGYLSGSEIRGYASGSDIPPTPGSGSITLPGSLEGSRLTSPRPSIIGGRSRKRALSHSPISDYLDIQSLTRSSEGSLQLTSFLGQHNSRSSSAASGSYGHLSAASLGTSSPHPPLPPNPYFRHGPMMPPGAPFFYPPMLPPGIIGRPHPAGLIPPGHHGMHPHHPPPQAKFDPQISTTVKDAGSSVVSSTMESSEGKKSKIKKEVDSLEAEQEEEDEVGEGYGAGHIPQEGEPDFIETNCHWVGCSREYETQDELVKHINQDHIQANKKSFVCRWKECSREEKPFKAQYMLVVHMRRHTGEKPHRCTFEGCNKAYSRLENLKTHLRSHTGEKPYLCEFPGCTKAFSNASDRAKHQNRTHSNAKPYACKASGCTKRYTDPSSLRKHVKTVHGPEFYANKKHKGDGCKKEDPDQDHDDKDDDGSRKAEDCIAMTPLQGAAITERRRSQDTVGSGPQSQPSPQSSPEVNVTCGLQPDMVDDQTVSSPPALTNSVDDEDLLDPEDAEVPGGSGGLMTRRHQLSTSQVLQNRMKGRLNAKATSPAILPHIPPPLHSPPGGTGGRESSFTEFNGKTSQSNGHSPLHKRISDLSARDQTNLLLANSRRNSNTSTLSSYMSSMRSETSPFPPMGSKMSSRRSSESSQVSNNRLSINNSPYEYDITGNRPHNSSTNSTSCSRRSSESSNCNVGTMSAMMQKAHLGSHPNLVVQQQQQGSNPPSTSNKYSNERLARYFAAKKDFDSNQPGSGSVNGANEDDNNNNNNNNNSTNTNTTNTCTNTPDGTPLPPDDVLDDVIDDEDDVDDDDDDLPGGRDRRRSSDPSRSQDPNFESLRRLQRFHSLNTMKPLPVPANMRSLHSGGGGGGNNNNNNNIMMKANLHSSRSSIATDYSAAENTSEQGSPNYSFPGDLDADAALDERLLEDSDDMIIPDDMQQFLNERYHNTHSQPTSEDMQRYYNERYSSTLSGSDHQPHQRQPSQMSFVDSAGVDSGCGSQMSGHSSSVGNFLGDHHHQQISPPLSQPMTPHRGQGHFSPTNNLQVQTGGGGGGGGGGFDSTMSSPMPSVHSPYSNQPMTPSPIAPQWPSQQGQGQMQGQMPMQGPMQPQQQGQMQQGHFCQQQQPAMMSPPHQPHAYQYPHPGPMRGMQIMAQGGHCPNAAMMMGNGNMGGMIGGGNMRGNVPLPGNMGNNAAAAGGGGGGGMCGNVAGTCGGGNMCMGNNNNSHMCGAGNGNVTGGMLMPSQTCPSMGMGCPHHHHHAGMPAAMPSPMHPWQQQPHQHQQQGSMATNMQQSMGIGGGGGGGHHHHHHHHHPQQQPHPYPDMVNGDLQGQVYSPTMPHHPGHPGHQSVKSPMMGPGGDGMMGAVGGGGGVGGGPTGCMGHKPSRSSPQVQVPHISQSQIPPNAKAASRNMMVRQQMMSQQMMMQQQQQQQQHQQQQQQQQSMPPPAQPNMYMNNPTAFQYNSNSSGSYPAQPGTYPGNGGVGMGPGGQLPPPPPPPPQQQQQQPQPQQRQQQQQQQQPPNNSAVVNGSQNTGNNSAPDFSRRPQHHQHQHQRSGFVVPPGGASTPTGMFRHPHPPSSQHPSCHRTRRSPRPTPQHPQQGYPSPRPTPQHPQPQQPGYPYPMEMSPGCNQVTSSTDRKETTAPPIEDFMENIASLSTENLIQNISSESNFGSQSSLPNRSASQNSNRYNPLLNTSNMVVNDMSSMLTQLAEENKYLGMRP